ncbi:MAG TPA: GNAT family N-acyltransferase [Bacilli bacterium]|nr:GNAT family N-acyltransferase [Bacilli bacterium]
MKLQEFTVNNIKIKVATTDEKTQIYSLRYKSLILDYDKSKKESEGLDKDDYDDFCDYIVAIDMNTNEVVGTYRLIRKEHAQKAGMFSTEKEFNIDNLKNKNCDILEIGRAVVKEEYRDGLVIGLLWKAVIRYALLFKIKYLFGTASFHGTDPKLYQHSLSSLYYNHLSPPDKRAFARKDSRCDLQQLPITEVDPFLVKKEMPPLIKGYINLWATIGEGAYIDHSFKSIDVLILLEIDKINPRYLQRYLED